jgi:hypothetical protein
MHSNDKALQEKSLRSQEAELKVAPSGLSDRQHQEAPTRRLREEQPFAA